MALLKELWTKKPDFTFTGVCFGHQLLARLLGAEDKVECWGTSSHTKVQGLYIRNRLFTTQAHVGFDEDMVKSEIAMREEAGGIQDSEHASRAKETAHLEHDGKEVAKAILRVIRTDDDGGWETVANDHG